MANAVNPEKVILSPVGVIAEAWAAIKQDFWLYLRWALVPLLFFIAEIASTYIPLGVNTQQRLQVLQKHFVLFSVGGVSFAVLFILSMLCFSVRVYRHIIAGDTPDQNFFAQMFSARVWKCFGKELLAGLKWALYSLPFAILGIIIIFKNITHIPLTPTDILLGTAVSGLAGAAGFLFLAEQVTLIGPDVAVDAPATFARLSRLAKQHRIPIALTMFLIAIVPWVVQGVVNAVIAADFLRAFTAAGGAVPNPEAFNQAADVAARELGGKQAFLNVLARLFYLAWWVMALFASAVIYKRLHASWPAEENVAHDPARFSPGLSPEPGQTRTDENSGEGSPVEGSSGPK